MLQQREAKLLSSYNTAETGVKIGVGDRVRVKPWPGFEYTVESVSSDSTECHLTPVNEEHDAAVAPLSQVLGRRIL